MRHGPAGAGGPAQGPAGAVGRRRGAARPGRAQHALLVWNGDWVQSGGEDGKGLSAVREAIAWEVGFAPAACRAESVRGFILFTLTEAPGAPRLAIGAPAWRWADLLGAR